MRKIKPSSSGPSSGPAQPGVKLQVGNQVEHQRFGKGKVLKIEGVGADVKAEIQFEQGGLKKLLLRFAKLNVLD